MASEPRAFSLPFREAIDYLRGKLSVPTNTWTDLWQDQHAIGFMVAGASTAELVADLRDAVTKALAEGGTIHDFRRDFDRLVARHGWSYRGGRGWRTRVIFETNLRMAYMAGKWQQAQDTKATRPYLRYSAVLDSHTRPLHRQWHGTILPIDDEWWRTHYPPNDWGCRCTVMTVAESDLKRHGWKVADQAPVSLMRTAVVNGVGPVEVPEGIGPGFGYNVGIAAQRAQAARLAAAKMAAMPADLGAVVAKAFPGEMQRALADEYRSWLAGLRQTARPDGQYRVIGALSDAVVGKLQDMDQAPESAAVGINAQQLYHMVRESKVAGGRAISPADLERLPDLVASPDAVLLDKRDGKLVLVFTPLDAEEARAGKIIIALDRTQMTDRGAGPRRQLILNMVRTSGLVPREALTEPRFYQALDGEV